MDTSIQDYIVEELMSDGGSFSETPLERIKKVLDEKEKWAAAYCLTEADKVKRAACEGFKWGLQYALDLIEGEDR